MNTTIRWRISTSESSGEHEMIPGDWDSEKWGHLPETIFECERFFPGDKIGLSLHLPDGSIQEYDVIVSGVDFTMTYNASPGEILPVIEVTQ